MSTCKLFWSLIVLVQKLNFHVSHVACHLVGDKRWNVWTGFCLFKMCLCIKDNYRIVFSLNLGPTGKNIIYVIFPNSRFKIVWLRIFILISGSVDRSIYWTVKNFVWGLDWNFSAGIKCVESLKPGFHMSEKSKTIRNFFVSRTSQILPTKENSKS